MVCCSESRDPFGRHRPPWISLFFWSRRRLAMKRYHVLVLFLSALSLAPAVGMADVIVTEKIMIAASSSCCGVFSRGLAANGQSVVAGLDSPGGMPGGSGAVDLFEENAMGDGYTPVDTLFASVPEANQGFGYSVGINGTAGWMAVGVPFHDTAGGVQSGSVTIYERDDVSGAWSWYSQVFNNPELAGGRFGTSLSMDGNRFVVGSPGYTGGGRVSVFKRHPNFCIPGTCWFSEIALLPPPGSGANDDFGAGVDLAGACEKFVVSAPNRGFYGAAIVYAFNNLLGINTWDVDHIIASPNSLPGGQFGGNISGGVALTCDYVAVAQKNTRQVWVFSAADYGIEAALSEPGNLAPTYGESIDLSGERLVVADPEFDTGRGSQGVVYYYLRIGPDDWERVATLAAPDGSGFNRFGTAVEIDGDRLFISAPGEDAVYYVDLDSLIPVSVPAIGPAGLATLLSLMGLVGWRRLRA